MYAEWNWESLRFIFVPHWHTPLLPVGFRKDESVSCMLQASSALPSTQVESSSRAMAERGGAASDFTPRHHPQHHQLLQQRSSSPPVAEGLHGASGSSSSGVLRRRILDLLPEVGLLEGPPGGDACMPTPVGALVPFKVGSFDGCSTPRDQESTTER